MEHVDIVKQLRRMAMRTKDSDERNTLADAADEIVRLRAAGDALVGALENGLMATAVVLINQWKDTRCQ